MKTKEIIAAYRLLNEAKLTKMEDEDKFKAIKMLRKMKKVVKDFEDFQTDAMKRLQDDDFDEMQKKAMAFNEKHKGQNVDELTEEDYEERKPLDEYFNRYQEKVNNCLSEEADKEHEIEKLEESAFEKLVTSNDWQVNQIMMLNEILV